MFVLYEECLWVYVCVCVCDDDYVRMYKLIETKGAHLI
jgi:hypothetical protein